MRTQSRFSEARWLGVLLMAGLLTSNAQVARGAWHDGDHEKHPGYIDGSDFVDLASDDGTLVEVSIHGPLLKHVARAMSHKNEHLGDFLGGIASIQAVVIERPTDRDAVKDRVKEIAEQLQDDDWERLARVREKNSEVGVYVLYDNDGETINGMTVIVHETNELVFVNLAGKIDLEIIGELGMAAEIPGLEDLGDDWDKLISSNAKRADKAKRKAKKAKKAKSRKSAKSESRKGDSEGDGRSEGGGR